MERNKVKEWLIGKLGGVPMHEWASADHRRQIAESGHDDTSERLRVMTAAFELKTQHAHTMRKRLQSLGCEVEFDGTDPIAATDAYQHANALYEELMQACTLENTPTAYIDDRYDYGTDEGDAPISEDAGSDSIEAELNKFLAANPQLERTARFHSYYREIKRGPTLG